jgi:hypothetical protein
MFPALAFSLRNIDHRHNDRNSDLLSPWSKNLHNEEHPRDHLRRDFVAGILTRPAFLFSPWWLVKSLCTTLFSTFARPLLYIGYRCPGLSDPISRAILSGFVSMPNEYTTISSSLSLFIEGQFDIFLASHQIWHFAALAAFLWWYYNGVQLLQYRLIHPCESQLN